MNIQVTVTVKVFDREKVETYEQVDAAMHLGNPLFNAWETEQVFDRIAPKLLKAIEAVHGVKPAKGE